MLWQFLADLVLILHIGFIIFVVFGGWLTLLWPWMPWVHLPAVFWGIALEFGGWICPLTPLENRLRQAGGRAGYPGGFIEQYLLPVIYPSDLTPNIQFVLGLIVILINVGTYSFLCWQKSQAK